MASEPLLRRRIADLEAALNTAADYLERLPSVPATRDAAAAAREVLSAPMPTVEREKRARVYSAAGTHVVDVVVLGDRVWLRTHSKHEERLVLLRELTAGLCITIKPPPPDEDLTERELDHLGRSRKEQNR